MFDVRVVSIPITTPEGEPFVPAFCRAFRVEMAVAERLAREAPTVVKRSVSIDVAHQFKLALERLGAGVELLPRTVLPPGHAESAIAAAPIVSLPPPGLRSSPPSGAPPSATSSSVPPAFVTIVCPTHGLRFDPATGCVSCRARARPFAEAQGSRVKGLLAVLALLVLGAGAWIGRDAIVAKPAEAPRFTERQLLDEARRVHVVIYSATWCPSCDAAKTFLWENGISYEEHDIDKEKDAHDHWLTLNPARTIPTIDVEGTIVVGADPKPLVLAVRSVAERHLTMIPATP